MDFGRIYFTLRHWRWRKQLLTQGLIEIPPLPSHLRIYCSKDWSGNMGAGSSAGTSTSNGDFKFSSKSVGHRREEGGTLEVTSHFDNENSYEELRDWVPVNACLYESLQVKDSVDDHETRVSKMQEEIFDGGNPWQKKDGTVDGEPVTFEVVEIGSSFAAIAQLPDALLTVVSRGVPLQDLDLVTYVPVEV